MFKNSIVFTLFLKIISGFYLSYIILSISYNSEGMFT